MDFAFSEEQEAFRDALRRFLEEKSPTAEVFRLIDTPEGHDPSVEHGYFNLLLGVLREAIDQGARQLDLGQTAEVPKTRLGGRLVEKSMFATHPSRIVQLLVQRGRGLLEYRRQVPQTHVFKV